MINSFDQQLSLFLSGNRSGFLTAVFSFFSFLGNWQFIVPAVLLVIVVLAIKKKKVFIAPFLLSVLGSEVVTYLGKWYFHRTRPLFSVFTETGFSFPSGHSTIAVAFFGFLAFMFVRLNNKRSGLVYSLTILIIVLIGFSRIYLGAHYLSDVLVGFLVGLLGLMAGIAWTDRLILRRKKS